MKNKWKDKIDTLQSEADKLKTRVTRLEDFAAILKYSCNRCGNVFRCDPQHRLPPGLYDNRSATGDPYIAELNCQRCVEKLSSGEG